ncbi:hypothetical protein HY990_00630 [Candidatus Micrarchaeota archaeon]|nr:hypothetical protein [Candidatus Micrarchaeota archaeon]
MFRSRILAHRGLWYKPEEKNTLAALVKAVELGFGIETDFRDQNRTVVVSHDMPHGSILTFRKLLEELSKLPKFKEVWYALNIKADGIEDEMVKHTQEFGIAKTSFVFDMSFPTAYQYRARIQKGAELLLATRVSEPENEPPYLYRDASVVWVDYFENPDWFSEKDIQRYLRDGKKVALVSPELHKMPHEEFWNRYVQIFRDNETVMICTDLPEAFAELVEE